MHAVLKAILGSSAPTHSCIMSPCTPQKENITAHPGKRPHTWRMKMTSMKMMYSQTRGQSDVAVRNASGLPLLVQLSCCSTFLLRITVDKPVMPGGCTAAARNRHALCTPSAQQSLPSD